MAKSGLSGKRPKLPPVSDEIRHLCAELAQEMARWPGVTLRPMFGMRALYRGSVVFAMLPDKRALESPRSVAYKLPSGAESQEGEKWKLVELDGENDVAPVLARLRMAYRKAGAPAAE